MPTNILFLSHKFYPDIGGIEVNSEILAYAFHQAGYKVHLITWSLGSGEKIFPFIVIRNPNKIRLLQEYAWANVVFENNPCLRLSWPNLFFAHPNIVAIRALISRKSGRKGWIDRLKIGWLKRASGTIAVSEAIRISCWPSATVIGNPYRINEFRVLPGVKRTIDFVFLGRLVSQKGTDQAILAVHQLINLSAYRRRAPAKPKLTIIGDGPERSRLENLIVELNLKEYVHFTGPLHGEDLIQCLNRHRFILVPSIREEAFGNVALEGMACGCLPIVSDCGGLPDAVGNAGLKFRSGDVNDLLTCIQKVLDNPVLEQQIRDAATSHLAAHHPDVIAQRYLEVISKALCQN